ncbi:MAG: peptide MFS transporter [Gemmatimonadales bacterium]|nr:peptide MFS transporter [Gemmatimonadales bacterium]
MSGDRAFFGHPRGLATLFFTELWERFSYYGMRALLILFMTAPLAAGGLAFETSKAAVIYGTYTASVYLGSLPGGWIADNVLGLRRATLWGGIIIACGHVLLAIPSEATFFAGLATVIAGTSLLKPNISTIVGQLYAPDDARRDAGFSLYYMGINLGAFLAPLVTTWLAQSPGFRATLAGWGLEPESAWHWGFGAAAVGMFAGVVQFVLGQRHVGADTGLPTGAAAERARRRLLLGLGGFAVAAAVLGALVATGALAISAEAAGRAFAVAEFALCIGLFGWMFLVAEWTPDERKRLLVVFVLFLASCVFWSVFEQAGSTLNLFADRSTRNEVLGFAFPSGWWQSVNSFWIITLAPVLSWVWLRLGPREPSSPAKFVLSLTLISASFFLMMAGARLATDGARVSALFLLGTYLMHSVGELCLSPVGMSAMTRLAPARMQGLMMGVWFLSISVGNLIGGQVASVYERFALPTLFGAVAAYAGLFAVVLLLLVRPIGRMLRA